MFWIPTAPEATKVTESPSQGFVGLAAAWRFGAIGVADTK
jgi:hypothetical protein